MTPQEKKIYNKNYYQQNKDYWVEWRKKHEQGGGYVPTATPGHDFSGGGHYRSGSGTSYTETYKKSNSAHNSSANAYQKLIDQSLRTWNDAQQVRRRNERDEAAAQKRTWEQIRNEALRTYDRSRRVGALGSGDYYTAGSPKGDSMNVSAKRGQPGVTTATPTELLARYNQQEALSRASKLVKRNTPVASLPAPEAPLYERIGRVVNSVKNELGNQIDAIAYAGSVAIDRAKELVKSFWDRL